MTPLNINNLKIVRAFLDEIQKRYYVDSAYLFGSYAKGTQSRPIPGEKTFLR
jgi:predicted nucleotidyltransferase